MADSRRFLVVLGLLALEAGPLWAQAPALDLSETNHLKQIALAMHNYNDKNRGLPSAAICDNAGKPLLSWRVAVLPFLEQDTLYRQFKLDEPWDGPNNKKLIEKMPSVFGSGSENRGETSYRVFFGDGALFDLKQKTPFRQVSDGLSNTFMVVEASESVPWTAPKELEYHNGKALPKLGRGRQATFFAVAFADGSVRRLPTGLPEAKLRAGITKAGGEVVNFDD